MRQEWTKLGTDPDGPVHFMVSGNQVYVAQGREEDLTEPDEENMCQLTIGQLEELSRRLVVLKRDQSKSRRAFYRQEQRKWKL